MQLSGKAKGRLRTRETHHLLMKERYRVPGERVVMKAVLKAAIWPNITQITVYLDNPTAFLYKVKQLQACHIILLLQLFEIYRYTDMLQSVTFCKGGKTIFSLLLNTGWVEIARILSHLLE